MSVGAALDGLGELEGDRDALALTVGDTLTEAETDGESDVLGLRLAVGLTDVEAEADRDADTLGESDADGDNDPEADGLMLALGLILALAEIDALIEGEIDADGLRLALADAEALTLGEREDIDPGCVTSLRSRPSNAVMTVPGNVPVETSPTHAKEKRRIDPCRLIVSVMVPAMTHLPYWPRG